MPLNPSPRQSSSPVMPTSSDHSSPPDPLPLGLLDDDFMHSQPICTPVDQPILRRDATTKTPGRTAVKRRRGMPVSADYPPSLRPPSAPSSQPRVEFNSQMSIDDEPRFCPTQSQRADLPDMSQDTLLMFPGVVREQMLLRTMDNDSSANQRQRPASLGNDPTRRSLARASFMSTLSGAKSMPNPFLTAADTQERLQDDAPLAPSPLERTEFVKRSASSSDSFRDMDDILADDQQTSSPFVLPHGGVLSLGKNMSKSQAEDPSPLRTLKLLLVSSTQGRTLSLDFETIREAGKGAFSEVLQVRRHLDGCTYAVKRNVQPLLTHRQQLDSLQEVFALSALQSHPNILRYHDAWFEDRGKYLHIQTEFLSMGSLYDAFVKQSRRMPAEELLNMAGDMSSALAFMHQKGIVHLDVKPDNIFCTNRGPSPKAYIIGDFGLACHQDGKDARSTEGDARYLCPEALATYGIKGISPPVASHGCGDSSAMNLTSHVKSSEADELDLKARDVFALGASLYELATAVPLQVSGDDWQRFRRNTSKAAREVGAICDSPELEHFVRRCLEPDPKKRATASELLQTCEEQASASSDSASVAKLKKENEELKRIVNMFDLMTTRLLDNGEKHRKKYREACGDRSGIVPEVSIR
eukprot:GFKZ01014427.1.p1 GENE.GFKZ01014427.1~~GFKZ01014427.1.p1  ORF type:complete len:640 (+),score=81.16 GFKZ01014427.1:334-2253(+)